MIKTIVSVVKLPHERIMQIADPVNFEVCQKSENGNIEHKIIPMSKEKFEIIESIMMRIVNDELIQFREFGGLMEGRLNVEVL